MSKKPRKVFGRRKFCVDGKMYRFELKRDGLHVREQHHRKVWLLRPNEVLHLCRTQLSLF